MPDKQDLDLTLLKSLTLRSNDSLQTEMELLHDQARRILARENHMVARTYGSAWIPRAACQEILTIFADIGEVTNDPPQLHLIGLLDAFHQRLLALEGTDQATLQLQIDHINQPDHPASNLRAKRYTLEDRMALLAHIPEYRKQTLVRDIIQDLRKTLTSDIRESDLDQTDDPDPTI